MSAFGPKRTFCGGITRRIAPIKLETSLVIWRRESSPLRQRIGSKQGQFAESCDCGLQMRSKRAPRIPDAIRRPSPNGCRASLRQWSTRVGVVTHGADRSRLSRQTCDAASRDVVIRCKSLNESICAVVASGMKSDVNIWRKAGLS